VFASRRIYDSFAVVSTDGVPNVPVKSQNHPIGSTDSQGLLLAPSLRSYERNKISIDPTNLPIDLRIERVNLDAVPRYASGIEVKFAMQRIQAASMILHQPDGQNVAMGSEVFLNGGTQPAGWVGYDGRLYLEGLQSDNHLLVRNGDATCAVHFAYHDKAGTLPELGPLPCTP